MATHDEEKGNDAQVEYQSVMNESSESKMTAKEYLKSRIPTLKPTMTLPPNPFKLLGLLSRKDWNFFGVSPPPKPVCVSDLIQVAFLAWTWDAFDFFTVSLTTTELAKAFDRSITDITWGLTLVLMLRSIGSVTFGIASDRYGRKYGAFLESLTDQS